MIESTNCRNSKKTPFDACTSSEICLSLHMANGISNTLTRLEEIYKMIYPGQVKVKQSLLSHGNTCVMYGHLFILRTAQDL
jgi:hypothetical protein